MQKIHPHIWFTEKEPQNNPMVADPAQITAHLNFSRIFSKSNLAAIREL